MRLVLGCKLVDQNPIRPRPCHHRKIPAPARKLDLPNLNQLRISTHLLKRRLHGIVRQPKMPRQGIRAPHRHNAQRRHRRTHQPLHDIMHRPIATAGKHHLRARFRRRPRLQPSRSRSLSPNHLNRMPQPAQRLSHASKLLLTANPAASRRRIEDQHQSHAPILRANRNGHIFRTCASIQQTMCRTLAPDSALG